jgi:membrane-associated phospholipid phosphatase
MTRISPVRVVSSRLTATLLVLVLSSWLPAAAQSFSTEASLPDAPQAQTAPNAAPQDPVTILGAPRAILHDQAAIWTSPIHIHDRDLAYLVPLGLTTALLMTTDHQVMSSSRLQDTSLNNHAVDASNGLVGGFVAAPVIIWGLGHIHHDDHATEAGILGGEAMVDSIVVEQVLKIASMRERPTVDNARGKFFQTSAGIDSSFPSSHSMVAWSSAAVIASEYPGPLTKLTAYGLATGVSLTRVLGRQHFPSDVLVGSAFGWMIGRYVFHRHQHQYDE